jgi:hypothetical protein
MRLILAMLLLATSAVGAIEPPQRPLRRVPLTGSAVTRFAGGNVAWMPIGGDNVSPNADEVQTPVDGLRVRVFRCTVTTAPGVGESVTLELISGNCGTLGAASPTPLACSITNTATEGSGSASVLIGECGAVKITYSAGASTSVPTYRLEVQ